MTGSIVIPFLCKAFDRVTNKLFPLDICQILILKFNDVVQPRAGADGIEYRFLTPAEVAAYAENPAADFGDQMHESMQHENLRCYAALEGTTLLGYAWVADGDVSHQHNAGGHQFTGLGLQLESNISYLFKCFVLPEHRGRGVNQQLLWRLTRILGSENKDKIITMTSWLNRAFQTSSSRIGFKKIGMASEWKIFGSRYYWWSKIQSHGCDLYRPSLA